MNKHDIELIKKSVLKVVEYLETNYSFEVFEDQSKYNYQTTMTLFKGELVFGIRFHAIEGRDFFFMNRDQRIDENRPFVSLLDRVYPLFSEEQQRYSNTRRNEMEGIEKFSEEYYLKGMILDIEFLKEHFPEILKSGKLP